MPGAGLAVLSPHDRADEPWSYCEPERRLPMMISRQVSLAAALILMAAMAPGAVVAADRPNVIFILADDLGYGDLGCFGQRLIKTPNIDRLAAEGVRFTQAYAGETVCARRDVR